MRDGIGHHRGRQLLFESAAGQQCHAVGRHLSELMLGRPTTLDLARFGPGRILANAPVFESRRKII